MLDAAVKKRRIAKKTDTIPNQGRLFKNRFI
ncbi:hypothetical protein MGAS9429_Spy0877 [Streptococcus pyogenes MGAS9429]|uniref:Uncharacterized protein n=1 Tax=Streptococcus pyogenes serotype M12 (strain MGAS9429) TaxID=370551 RepID=Q1JM05_STRPC|nr:hypothetical protein MGAS9429_Spy0877 [Streptococcus pyogenes MGAS9429]